MNKNEFKKIAMTRHEKELLRSRIRNYVDATHTASIPSPYVSPVRRTHWYSTYAVVMILLFVVPTTFAADRSLPGSPLYYIKTDILEPLEETLTFDAERRVSVMIENTENRIRETHTILATETDSAESQKAIAIATKTMSKKASRTRAAIDENENSTQTEKILLQKELLTVMDSYVAIVATSEETSSFASTTESLSEASEDLELHIRESLDHLVHDSEDTELTDEIEAAIVEIQGRLGGTVENDIVIDDEERNKLQRTLEETQTELNEGDLPQALEVLLFSDHDIDVEERLREISGPEKNESTDKDVLADETSPTSAETPSEIDATN